MSTGRAFVLPCSCKAVPIAVAVVIIPTLTTSRAEHGFVKALTLSGGEPLLQVEALNEFLNLIKEHVTSVVLYTGYTFEEILDLKIKSNALADFLAKVDYIIDGRFVLAERDISLQFRGSRNQRIIDLKETWKAGKIVLKEF